MRILLAGQPNCGKTTLFNLLTGHRAPTGNRPGVTVEAAEAYIKGTGDKLLDLPGLYALSGGGADEELARRKLGDFDPDLIVNVADITALQRSLPLTLSLSRLQKNMVLVLTMADEGEKQGLKADLSALERALGIPCLSLCARRPGAAETVKGLFHRGRVPRYDAKWENPWERAKAAETIAKGCLKDQGQRRKTAADCFFCHRIWGRLIFFALLGLIFCLTFWWAGPPLSAFLEGAVLKWGRWAEACLPKTLPPFIRGLLGEGLWESVGTVLAFLPQVWLLYICMALLEDCGYLARCAFLLDAPMGKLGLEGRGAVMLLLGFGCTVPAALATRSLEKKEDREGVISLLPFVPCSAKLPLTAALARSLFPARAPLGVGLLYGMSLFWGLVWGRLKGRERVRPPMVLELPPWRMPHIKSVWKQAGDRALGFLLRAGPVLLLSAGGLWGLSHLTPALAYTESMEESLVCLLGRGLSPLLYPLGLYDWRQGVVLLSGAGAKETMAASLHLLYGGTGLPFSFSEGVSFGVFALLLPPCLGALGVMRGELGRRSRKLFFRQLLFAYGAAAVSRLCLRFLSLL